MNLLKEWKFPSPLGVIFSLIIIAVLEYGKLVYIGFPSPLGVIFSLILYSKNFLFVIVYRAIIV